MTEFILGAHSLSAMFTINDREKLKQAMETTAKRGGRLFEMPYLLCKLAWEEVAMIAQKSWH